MSHKTLVSSSTTPRESLSTQISSRHHTMLDELNSIGMMKNAAIEKGIEMYYAKMARLGLISGNLLQAEHASDETR